MNEFDKGHPICIVICVVIDGEQTVRYYLGSRDLLNSVGDSVVVPFGGGFKTAKIIFSKEYESSEELPCPYNSMNYCTRKIKRSQNDSNYGDFTERPLNRPVGFDEETNRVLMSDELYNPDYYD